MKELNIIKDDLRSGDVIDLLDQHRREMFQYSPPESVHALDIDALNAPNLTFWSVWYQGEFAACGALKELDEHHGEVKSMKTKPEFLRRGIAASLMQTILEEAKARGYVRVSLETGTMDAFLAARTLYETLGFVECPPFADYVEDEHSVFMTKRLD